MCIVEEETVRAEVAPGASLDGIRRSETAEVPEETGAETSAGWRPPKGKKKPNHAFHAAAADVSTAVEMLLNLVPINNTFSQSMMLPFISSWRNNK